MNAEDLESDVPIGSDLSDPDLDSRVSSPDPAQPISPLTGLKGQLIRGSIWTIVGFGISQVLRFGNNLILTRLLDPAVFGVMALIQAVITGLSFLTDVGIGPAVINNKTGDDRRFLGTAWTIQIIRNAAIWLGCCLVALPVSWVYDEPQMTYALPVAALSTFVAGFVSINIFLMNKYLRLGPQTLMDLGTQFIGMIVMIVVAYYTHSLWSLLIGTFVATLLRAIISHWLLPEVRPMLVLDRTMAKGMLRFGRWITISTMITFVLTQGHQLILGLFLDKAELGIYSIGYMLPAAAVNLASAVATRVLFPTYSRLIGEGQTDLRPRIRKISITLMAIVLPPLWLSMIFAQNIIRLYKPIYHDAGWIFRIYTISSLIDTVTISVVPVLLARGNSFGVLITNLTRLVCMVVAGLVGYRLGGTSGLIVGFAVVPLFNYPVVAWYAARSRAWTPLIDLFVLASSAVVFAIGWKLGL